MKAGLKFIVVIVAVLFLGLLESQAQSAIEWTSLSEAQELAKTNNKKVMIFAEAEWCGYCKKMYKEVFPKNEVQDSLQKYFHPVKLDIESGEQINFNNESMSERQLARQFRVSSTPTFIFLDSEGNVIGRQPGFLPANIFDKLVAFVGMDLTGKKSFKAYLQKYGVKVD